MSLHHALPARVTKIGQKLEKHANDLKALLAASLNTEDGILEVENFLRALREIPHQKIQIVTSLFAALS